VSEYHIFKDSGSVEEKYLGKQLICDPHVLMLPARKFAIIVNFGDDDIQQQPLARVGGTFAHQ